MKSITRSKIAEHEIEKAVVMEKRVLNLINHPLMIRLYTTFKDDYALHFLMNEINGLDMFDLIR